jgi:hypothetical protein
MIAILITNKNSLKKSSGPASGPDERTDLRELRVGPTARAPPPRPRLPLFIKSSKPGSSGSHLCKQEFEALPGGVLSLSIHICSQLPAQCVSLDFSVVYPVALSLVFFFVFLSFRVGCFPGPEKTTQICTQESEVCWFQFCLLLSNQRSEARPYKAREVGGIAEGMGKSSGTATTTNASWTFEIAPPHIITVERTSPKQRSLETILENISAMALWLETAPPELITVDRGYSTRAGSTLDTIAEENMSTTMAAGGGGHML